MDQDDFENVLEIFEINCEDMDLKQLKEIQRTLTFYINIAQGYYGGKHVKKENINTMSCGDGPNPFTQSIISNDYRPVNSPVAQMQEFVVMSGYVADYQPKAAKKKEEEMNTETQDQRHYLARQLSSVAYTKEVEALKSFGLINDQPPRKGSELLDRIKSGKYILRDEKSVKWAESALDYIEWRDPAIVKDQDGFEAAVKVMQKSRLDTDRTIQIADPTDGLSALKAFEAMSFDKTASVH